MSGSSIVHSIFQIIKRDIVLFLLIWFVLVAIAANYLIKLPGDYKIYQNVAILKLGKIYKPAVGETDFLYSPYYFGRQLMLSEQSKEVVTKVKYIYEIGPGLMRISASSKNREAVRHHVDTLLEKIITTHKIHFERRRDDLSQFLQRLKTQKKNLETERTRINQDAQTKGGTPGRQTVQTLDKKINTLDQQIIDLIRNSDSKRTFTTTLIAPPQILNRSVSSKRVELFFIYCVLSFFIALFVCALHLFFRDFEQALKKLSPRSWTVLNV